MAETCPIMLGNSAQLFGRFGNITRFDFPLAIPYQAADLQVEPSNFRRLQVNAFLARGGPAERAVESFRGGVRRKKGNRVQAESMGRPDGVAEISEIGFLSGAARMDGNSGAQASEFAYSGGEPSERSGDTSHSVMNAWRAVD